MPDQPRRPFRFIFAGILCLLLLYTFSVGPAVWVVSKTDESGDPLMNATEFFYAPLTYAMVHAGTEKLLDRYLEWWL